MTQTVADQTIAALDAAGIDRLYCLPGVQNDHFFDALYDHRQRITPVVARHEQGAAYMALGAALATGRPQAFCVVPGPGFLNATAALATAQSLNAPVLAIIGQIPSPAIGKGTGQLHEIPDQFAILRQLTRAAWQIQGTNAAEILSLAVGALQSGPPGPIGIEIPADCWRKPAVGVLAPTRTRPPAAKPGPLAAAAEAIRTAKRPIIVVGSGAAACRGEVQTLAERIGAPVVGFRTGRGTLPDSHPLAASLPQAHALWPETDLVIGLGSRLEFTLGQWGRDDAMTVIRIEIDPARLAAIPADIAVEADLAQALPALLAALDAALDATRDAEPGAEPGAESDASTGPRPDWQARIAQTRARAAQQMAERLAPQLAWLEALRAAIPEQGILINELTQVGYVANIAYPVSRPRALISPGYQGTLGWGIATGLGAADALRDVPVVAISGDGGALFTIGELATAARYDIPLVTIVFNDNAFGNVRRFQEDLYGGRTIATDLASPDFVALAKSFGLAGDRADTPDALGRCISDALAARRPTVIEVPVGTFPSPWSFVLMPKCRGMPP
ncbi:MAG: thiamine pyrophosphate-dependent enzyme [Pseudomonadota bacterium]